MKDKKAAKNNPQNIPPGASNRRRGDPKTIKINPSFRDLIPPQTKEETAELERKLLVEGCRDPLVLWKSSNQLLDGHHRLPICEKHGIPFDVVDMEFASFEEARTWIIENQLSRRNLTPEAVSYLRGNRYNTEKQTHGGDHTSEEATGNGSQLPTDERLAAVYMVDPKTIRNDAAFATVVDGITKNCGQSFKANVLQRKVKLTRQQLKGLAKLKPDEQRATVKEVLKNGGINKAPAEKPTKLKDKISVPAEPAGLAAALLEQRGRPFLLKVQKALAKLLEAEEPESKEKTPASTKS